MIELFTAMWPVFQLYSYDQHKIENHLSICYIDKMMAMVLSYQKNVYCHK